MSFVSVPDAQVAFNAIISAELFTQMKANDDYLKSAITDGAGASQAISTSTLTASGNSVIGGNLNANGGVTGTSTAITPDAVFSADMAVNGFGINLAGDAFVTTPNFKWDLYNAIIETTAFANFGNHHALAYQD